MRHLVIVGAVLVVATPSLASPQRDINGDGFDDAALAGLGLGFGSAKGLALSTPAQVPVAPGRPTGPADALEVVGDVNGDGFADVMLGDPACPARRLDQTPCEVGRVHLFLGGPTGLAATPIQSRTASAKNTMFGSRIVGVGDVTGDKRADVAVVARDGIHLFRGTATGITATPVVLVGTTVHPAGDLDRDGRADLLTIEGPSATILYGADPKRAVAVPLGTDVYFRHSAGHGDFDGDGYGDLALVVEPATPESSTPVRVPNFVVVYRGGPNGLRAKPVARFTRGHVRADFGSWFASVGDLNGDKRDDLIIGASCSRFVEKTSSCEAGAAHVYLGTATGLARQPVATLSPPRTNYGIAGNHLEPLGDINGDSHADFVLGAYVHRGGTRGLADRSPPSL